ncbi:hypothetical protein M8J77_024241 [Diaphorina citri]|nr:hypothetical protein M8J77_024241 [Diaphorina citri]
MSSAMILMGGSSRSDGEGMISMELPGLQHGGGHHVDLSHQLQHHQQIMHHSLMDDSGKDGSMDSGNHGLNQEGKFKACYIFFISFTLVQAHRYMILKSTSSYQSPLTLKKGESFLLKPFPSIPPWKSPTQMILIGPFLSSSTFSQHQEGLFLLK